MANKVTNLVAGVRERFFRFRPGVLMTGGPLVVQAPLGVGAEGLGLMKPQTDPLNGVYDARKTVRGDLGPLSGAHMATVQYGPQVSLDVNGAGLHGAMTLQALAQFNSGG